MGSSESDSLSVIDPVAHFVVSKLSVGRYPYRVCYNPTANKVYCLTGSDLDTVSVVDCSSDSVLARIWVGWNEYPFSQICCNPVGNKVYVSSFETGSVAVIDGVSDSLLKSLEVGDYPAGLVYSPVSNKLYCSVFEDDEVAVFDAGPDTLLKTIEVGWGPIALGYNPISNKVYCGNSDDRNVAIIDCHADTVLASLGRASGEPRSFLFDSVDNRVFCFSDYYDSIMVISGSGDTILGSVELIGDADDPDPACYEPQENRIYIRGRTSADVTVVDAASCEPVAAIQMNPNPRLVCYAELQDKLYCSDDASGLIAVINCSTDSLERRIFTPAWDLGSPVYSSGSNKLYYSAYLSNSDALLVVNCAHDSFEAALPMNFDAAPAIVYNPAMDRIYWAGNLGESTVVVVDCAGDSVVGEVPVGQYPCALACNPDSNRVYCASYRADSLFISAIDCAADSVTGAVSIRSGYYYGPLVMCYVQSRDVVCCGTGDSIVVVDGAATQVVGYARPGGIPSKFHLDRASNKLYCLLPSSDDLAVIDCRDMSLEAKIRLAAQLSDMAFDSVANRLWATSPNFGCISLVDGRTNRFLGLLEAGQTPGDITWVPQHRRMYAVDQKGQAIFVFRDTSLVGLNGELASGSTRSMATVVRGVLFLPEAASHKPQAASLLDVSGRKVLDLKPGANDVRRLAPGVYFVREEPEATGRKPQAVRKIVVTR
jgi:YVTN family beta-propeller protein